MYMCIYLHIDTCPMYTCICLHIDTSPMYTCIYLHIDTCSMYIFMLITFEYNDNIQIRYAASKNYVSLTILVKIRRKMFFWVANRNKTITWFHTLGTFLAMFVSTAVLNTEKTTKTLFSY